jgi:hypothetical protein
MLLHGWIVVCSLDLETILKYQQDLRKQRGDYDTEQAISLEDSSTRAIEDPGGYFKEPGGYIIDTRNKCNE